ncbi:polyprenyl synthetase family protein [Allokutzneria albata]|uniref:Geranylgeranyl diphosphate synthase, type I n=1 Tax=Allokutzneria albata TaxID=211114 RepID=A0A1G9VNC1_ALLAB|nr:polyprenyl synthetase family protein [Allokutzneria albata]SDM73573.1 geranylgeranyl diphosphate synthase, type I [Allokutzneria albata]
MTANPEEQVWHTDTADLAPKSGDGVLAFLAECRATVVPVLREAVDTLPPPVRRVAGYHFGWLDEHGRPVADDNGGKMIRPALTLLSARAVGGGVEDAVPAAASVELVHNFSLLHDDIIDGDRTRRHRLTAWAAFGVPAAVLAGDALWALALRLLTDGDGATSAQTVRTMTLTLCRLIDGQSADTDFPLRHRVSISEVEDMAAGKTAAVMGCASALGALAGGGDLAQVSALQRMGENLGMAFQVVDDLLGIWGDPGSVGKPVGSDLTNRKKSFPVVAALASGTDAAAELASLYRFERPLTDAEAARAADLVEAAGGRAWALREAERYAQAARHALAEIDAAPDVTADLSALTALITGRDH